MKTIFLHEESTPISSNSKDVFAKTINGKIIVALPERLFCTTDQKLIQVIFLIMPKLFENYLSGIKGDHFKPLKKEIEISNEKVNVLVYHTKDNNKIFILPIKDPVKGIYMLEIWQSNK